MKAVTKILAGALAALAATPFTVGVVSAQSYRAVEQPTYENRDSAQLGVVQSIETVRGSNQGNRVAGAILGGVLGGVIGHQIGSGRGNDVATVAGALGGAAVGHGIARDKGTDDFYRVSVRMDNGETRVAEQGSGGGLRTGDRVRVDGNVVTLYAGDTYPSNQGYQSNQCNQGYQGYPAYQGSLPPPPDAYAPNETYAPDDRTLENRDRYDRDGYRIDDRGNRYDRDGNRIDDRPSNRNERTRPDPLYRMEGGVGYEARSNRVNSDAYRADDRVYRD